MLETGNWKLGTGKKTLTAAKHQALQNLRPLALASL
jgi:hypothetical protein